MTSFSAIFDPPRPVSTRTPPSEPWDLWADSVAEHFEARLLEAEAEDLVAAADDVGAQRLRRRVAEHDRLGRELRALADHWRELRGE